MESDATRRPTAVTVISWLLILTTAATAWTVYRMQGDPQVVELMENSPIPVSLQYALTATISLINLVAGISMLYGRGWGRQVWLAGAVIGWSSSLLTTPSILLVIPGLVFAVVVGCFLFGASANRYFASSSRPEPDVG